LPVTVSSNLSIVKFLFRLEAAVRRIAGWCELQPACKDVSPEAEECPLLEDVTNQATEDRD
jgi:hypothetical protein